MLTQQVLAIFVTRRYDRGRCCELSERWLAISLTIPFKMRAGIQYLDCLWAVRRTSESNLNPNSERWQPGDCAKCAVPKILLANADPDLELTVTIRKGFLGFGRKVEVVATSKSDGTIIENPYVGRTDKNNPGLEIFRQALEDLDED